jgi:hypothetical protein
MPHINTRYEGRILKSKEKSVEEGRTSPLHATDTVEVI